jgi:hypothetical protein
MVLTVREAVAENAEDDPLHVSACFDGTWQTDGHPSVGGVMSPTSFDSGEAAAIELTREFYLVRHINPTSQHECKQDCAATSGGLGVPVCTALSVVLSIAEVLAALNILAMSTPKHTRGWLQRSLRSKRICNKTGHVEKRIGAALSRLVKIRQEQNCITASLLQAEGAPLSHKYTNYKMIMG